MERLRELLRNDGVIFLFMGVLAVMKEMISTTERINLRLVGIKLFIKIASGVGFYSFLLSYKEWYGQYPQKIGIIMVCVFAGDKVIDIVIDRIYYYFNRFDIKTLMKKLFDL
jgi:hypothetical protein